MFAFDNPRRSPVPHAFAPQAELLCAAPRILVSREAYQRMSLYVELANEEIGWLGTVRDEGMDFFIEEVFLIEQQCGAVTTQITPGGLADFATRLLATREDGEQLLNRLRFWGHSHVTMGTSPSGQDEEQMRLFDHGGNPWFIRGILNKLGRMEFTLFFFRGALKITDVPWQLYDPADPLLRLEIATEIREKVRPLPEPPVVVTRSNGRGLFGRRKRG